MSCKETLRPLSLHYGVSETINCTIPELSDKLYHLLEFYVHSDVPMTCRIPTTPLSSSNEKPIPKPDADAQPTESDSLGALSEQGPPFTPLTIALQGTLQLSHLHIWTDMNMIMHNMASDAAAQAVKPGKQSKQPGYAVAGTAYSTPEWESTAANLKIDQDEAAVMLAQAAREPWTSGHGTKVVRGEPLTFSFHVAWVEGGAGIGWPQRSVKESFLGLESATKEPSGTSVGWFFSKLMFFVMAASVGGLAALYWEKNGGRWQNRSAWRGDGILGAPPAKGKGSGVTYGNGGRINGYGGYSAAANGAGQNGGGGYGFPSGKRE